MSMDDAYADLGDPAFERTPPQDVSAEQSVLGGMMLSADAIGEVVEEVRAADFYRPAHETIFEAIVDLYGRGEPADTVTVADQLRNKGQLDKIGGSAYLHDLAGAVPTAANAAYYAKIVRERGVLRKLVEAGTRIAQMGYQRDGGDVADIINDAQAEVFAATQMTDKEDYAPLSEILPETLEGIEKLASQGVAAAGVPTGYRDLDALTNGLHPDQMIVIAARPGGGKSTMGLDIARAAAFRHKKTVALFSLEMNKTEITMKLLAAEAGVQLERLRKAKMEREDWNRVVQAEPRMASASLFIDDSVNLKPLEIRSKARRIAARYGLDLIIIDYLQLMTSGKRVESRQQEVSEISRSMKLLAKELHVPVIAISQLNRNLEQRGGANKKPQLSDLRESGSIEQDADLVILLHREDYYEKEHPRAGEVDVIVAKHRNGPTKDIVVANQLNMSRFVDMAPGF